MIRLPKQLQDSRFRFVPCRVADKHTIAEKGQSWKPFVTDFIGIAKHEGNVGVLGGNGIMLIDLDGFDRKETEQIKVILGETFTVETGSRRGFHLYYFCDTINKDIHLSEEPKKQIEIRAREKYVLAPGSIHDETKLEYAVVTDVPITSVAPEFIELLKKLYNAFKIDNKLYQLWRGEILNFPSRSEAEASLITKLYQERKFSDDEVLIVMDSSLNGKWHERRTDSTREDRIKHCHEFAEQHPLEEHPKEPSEEEEHQVFFEFNSLGIPQPVSWFIPKYIPSTGITIIAGYTGAGKSFLTEEMISAVINSRKVFNRFDIDSSRPVLLVDMENDHNILYERLNLLGGVPQDKLFVFGFNEWFDFDSKNTVNQLFKFIEEKNPGLVIFDTLRRTYSGDENDSKIISDLYRRILKPISKDRCVMLLAHNRKASNGRGGNEGDPLSEIRGTGDISGLATSVIMVKKSEDGTFLFKPLKLRPAMLASPFVIGVRHEGEKIQFEVLNDVAIKSEIEVIADKLFSWLKHNKKVHERIKTAEMTKYLLSEGHKDRNISAGIKLLSRQGWLPKIDRGWYQFKYGDDTVVNFLPDEK